MPIDRSIGKKQPQVQQDLGLIYRLVPGGRSFYLNI